MGCDGRKGGLGSLGGRNPTGKCAGELGHSRFGVPIGQHKRRGAQGTPAALHFLKPQCFQQHGLGFGAGRVAGEGDGLIVGKQARAGILTGQPHDARSQ